MKLKYLDEKHWWLFALGAAIMVFILSMMFSYGQSVWFDEGYSILLAKNDVATLLSLTAVDAHPPLYYLLLKLWGSLFGFDEYALRSFSAILMAAAVAGALALIRKLFSTKIALYALPFLVLSPFIIRYGYEIRMYSLATLIGVVATYVLIKARENSTKVSFSDGVLAGLLKRSDTKWWLAYAVLVALGMYTLYMMVVVWLSHFVWQIIDSLKNNNREPFWKWRWLQAYVVAVVLFTPYIITFFWQLTHSALPGIGHAITLTQLVDIVSMLLLYTPEWALGGWLSLLLFSAVLMVIYSWSMFKNKNLQSNKSYVLFLALLVGVPIAFYALTSLIHPIFVNRYLAHMSIYAYSLIGVVLGFVMSRRLQFKDFKKRALVYTTYFVSFGVLLLGVIQLGQTGNFIFERMQHPQTEQLRASINCNSDTIVVADDPYTYIDSVFYFDNCDMRFYNGYEVEFKGGYAPLHKSPARVSSSEELDSPTVIRLGWDGKEPNFVVDARYHKAQSRVYGNQLVEVYNLIVK